MTVWKTFALSTVVATALGLAGCVKSEAVGRSSPFETEELDACLAIVIDMSGSFSTAWEDRAYGLFLDLSDQFFTEGMGSNTRLVISQLSGSDEAVLFDGKPSDLRTRFNSPEELNQFLQERSDASSSKVFDATGETLAYVGTMSGITERTRLLTVILSDMMDSEPDVNKRRESGNRMLASLKQYQGLGGGLALYFVAAEEKALWQRILNEAGFEPGYYVIENSLTQSPQLPRFE